MSTLEEFSGCNKLSTGQDADVAGQESSNSVVCHTYPETAPKRIQARVLPATCSQGKCITCMMCYTVQIEHLLFLYISTSINDVGVQFDLIPLPLLTFTPTQCTEVTGRDHIEDKWHR